jgi:hypothetical protein
MTKLGAFLTAAPGFVKIFMPDVDPEAIDQAALGLNKVLTGVALIGTSLIGLGIRRRLPTTPPA